MSRRYATNEFSGDPGEDRFETTQWSVVLAAGNADSVVSQAALKRLCGTYWYPLYVYARRRVNTVEEAQDLTQEFFAVLLEKNYVASADPERGKFRAFLLTSFKHFLANEWKRQRAQKRGGGRIPLSLDFGSAEDRYLREPADEHTPEMAFERQWAVTLINTVLARLREEFTAAGKERLFKQLKSFLAGPATDASYTQASKALQMSEAALRVAAHRLRRRYRELLREEIAHTVSTPTEVDDEIHNLFQALGL